MSGTARGNAPRLSRSILEVVASALTGLQAREHDRVFFNFRAASYARQMRMATRDLRAAIDQGEVSPSRLTAEQLRQIRSGAERSMVTPGTTIKTQVGCN